LEAARAHAALQQRSAADCEDVQRIAPLVLRQRRSAAIDAETQRVAQEDATIRQVLDAALIAL
jgi:MoxR-like ATPase